MNRSNNSSVSLRRRDKNDDLRSVTRPDSGISSLPSDSSLCQKTAKEKKDSANIASQQSNEGRPSPMETDPPPQGEAECTEFTDAVSELEPLQGGKLKSSPPVTSPPRLRHLSSGSTVSNRSA